jgi:hypothetical protein
MAAMTGPAANPPPGEEASPPPPDLGDRMKAFGDELGARGQELGRDAQQLGRDAQAAGERWSRDPGVVRAANTAGQLWGLILLFVGLYFFVEVTLGIPLPAVPWAELWPIALIVLGLVVITRGMTRRT